MEYTLTMDFVQRARLKVLLKGISIGVHTYNRFHLLSHVMYYQKKLRSWSIYATVSKRVHAYKGFYPKVSLHVLLKGIEGLQRYLCQSKRQDTCFQQISSKGKLNCIA